MVEKNNADYGPAILVLPAATTTVMFLPMAPQIACRMATYVPVMPLAQVPAVSRQGPLQLSSAQARNPQSWGQGQASPASLAAKARLAPPACQSWSRKSPKVTIPSRWLSGGLTAMFRVYVVQCAVLLRGLGPRAAPLWRMHESCSARP